MSTETNYEKALNISRDIPRFYIGQEVQTKNGRGIIVKIEMEWNGFYIFPDKIKATIWFGGASNRAKWISDSYNLEDLSFV